MRSSVVPLPFTRCCRSRAALGLDKDGGGVTLRSHSNSLQGVQGARRVCSAEWQYRHGICILSLMFGTVSNPAIYFDAMHEQKMRVDKRHDDFDRTVPACGWQCHGQCHGQCCCTSSGSTRTSGLVCAEWTWPSRWVAEHVGCVPAPGRRPCQASRTSHTAAGDKAVGSVGEWYK